MKILLVEDNDVGAAFARRALEKAGHEVVLEMDGLRALATLQQHLFDAVVTDWLLPGMDGPELLRHIRDHIQPVPITMLLTVLDSVHARQHALLTIGADEFIAKPFTAEHLVKQLEFCRLRRQQPLPSLAKKPSPPLSVIAGKFTPPPFVGIGIAASTGGIDAIRHILKPLNAIRPNAAIFIVQHGAGWMLETFADMLATQTDFAVRLAEDGMNVQTGHLYLAPGERHMLVAENGARIHLNDDAPENYVRPCADKLFRSIADEFGHYAVATVLSGLGCDGAIGCASIQGQGGIVLAQQPESCVAPYMPQSVIKLGLATEVVPLDNLGSRMSSRVQQLSNELRPVAN